MSKEIVEIDFRVLFGGITGGLVASLYAVGPMLLVIFRYSVTQALNLTKYQFHFIGTGVGITLLSLIISSRRKGKMFIFKMNKVYTLVGSFLLSFAVFVFIITPLASPIVYGTSSEETPDFTGGNYRQLTLKINGMTCAGCASGIQNVLMSTEGIANAKVSMPNSGIVIYDSNKITKEDILKHEIFSGFYSAEIIKDEEVKG